MGSPTDRLDELVDKHEQQIADAAYARGVAETNELRAALTRVEAERDALVVRTESAEVDATRHLRASESHKAERKAAVVERDAALDSLSQIEDDVTELRRRDKIAMDSARQLLPDEAGLTCPQEAIVRLGGERDAALAALGEAIKDLCPHCGVSDPVEQRNRTWVHSESDVVCEARFVREKLHALTPDTVNPYFLNCPDCKVGDGFCQPCNKHRTPTSEAPK